MPARTLPHIGEIQAPMYRQTVNTQYISHIYPKLRINKRFLRNFLHKNLPMKKINNTFVVQRKLICITIIDNILI